MEISIPLKEVKYNSRFEILDIPKDSDNPYYDDESKGMRYTVRLNTLNYYDANDNSIVYKLQPYKDFLTLENHYNFPLQYLRHYKCFLETYKDLLLIL